MGFSINWANIALLVCLTIASLLSPRLGGAEESQKEINELSEKMLNLDDKFQVVSDAFYNIFSKSIPVGKWDINSAEFPAELSALPGENIILIIANIRKNLESVCKSYAAPNFSIVVPLLYLNNETSTLKKLTDCLKAKSDAVAKAENYFHLAQYYYARKQWTGVKAALDQVNRKDLSVRDAQYADLLLGYALQEQKKHRDAVKIYKRIPPSSPYYAFAKLNEGIGYLRQGWWSEAHAEFKTAIASIKSQQNEELKNRILVVLGYSQLDYEFYRDARSSLRNVSLMSQYTNKALMGLGLAAAYQEDYKGAINAFSRLANNTQSDLSVDEAFLLVPSTYEELGDYNQSADSYLKAIEYYKNRINTLNAARADLDRSNNVSVPSLLEQLDARADELYGAKNLIPKYIVNNYSMLLAFKDFATNAETRKNIETLEQEYNRVLKALVLKNIGLRESILNSYLSQAKYGVAKLYDQP